MGRVGVAARPGLGSFNLRTEAGGAFSGQVAGQVLLCLHRPSFPHVGGSSALNYED